MVMVARSIIYLYTTVYSKLLLLCESSLKLELSWHIYASNHFIPLLFNLPTVERDVYSWQLGFPSGAAGTVLLGRASSG